MADFEAVLKGLEECTGKGFCTKCPYRKEKQTTLTCKKLLADVLSVVKEQEEEIENLKQAAQSMMEGVCLLKEQEPKPIVRKQVKRKNSDGSIEYYTEWSCPHCGKVLDRAFGAPWIEFCYKCGKEVKWG